MPLSFARAGAPPFRHLVVLDAAGRDAWAQFLADHYGRPGWPELEEALRAGADAGWGTNEWWWELEGGVLTVTHSYREDVEASLPLSEALADLEGGLAIVEQ